MRDRNEELARQRKKPNSNKRVLERNAASNLSGTGPWRALLICGVISLVHLIGLALLFTPLSGLFDSRPLIDQDWGLHFFHLNSLTAFWHEGHRLWGYNPFFMAGYPSNTIQDLSIKFFELAALGLSSIALSPVEWFKICAFLATASLPWMIYFAVQNFFRGDKAGKFIAALAALFGTVYWWNSLPREMFFYGMIGFPVACYLSVLGISLCYRLAQRREAFGAPHLGWLVFSAAIPPLHVQSVVVLLPPLIALFAARLACGSGGARARDQSSMARAGVRAPRRRYVESDYRATAAFRERRSVDLCQRLSLDRELLELSSGDVGKGISPGFADLRRM